MSSPDAPEMQTLLEAVRAESEKWRHCEGLPESTLLRLAILRDILRSLHAQKSRCLASGRREVALSLRAYEARLLELRSHPKLEGDLVELVTGTGELRKRTRLLPEALFAAIEREKLERYDRQWEAAIAAEAVAQGWKLWSLEAWVEITLVEEWNQRLSDQLWPSAVCLFVESGPKPPPRAQEVSIWNGRWILVAHPRFKSPAEITSNLAQWAGSPTEPPDAAAWKQLFSPKMR